MKAMSEMAPRFGGTPMLQGVISSFLVALVAVLITAMLVTWTSLKEASLPSITYIINVIAVLVGSWIAARRGGKKGWYYGGMTGLLYSVLVTFLGLLLVSSSFSLHHLIQITILSLIGGFGGIIGVNASRK